ncbi:GAF domain-containing protein [Halalkalirubrum salinum]|uniref:GAF domain-containing protein n=1 Tax=Halalkalirubrum salinum TaxID=2563889 RepID=UPI003742657C
MVENAFENREAKPSDQSIVSGLTVPLDDRGVFQGYASEPGAFDERDLKVTELLCAHATAALDRLEKEQELKRKKQPAFAVCQLCQPRPPESARRCQRLCIS